MEEGAVREIGEKEYKILKILKIQENSSTDGLQAMAVAPINKQGTVDTSNIIIAYAGTNSSDFNDLETDLRTVGGFFDKTVSPGFSVDCSPQCIAGQAESALAFATEIQGTYDNATITTTGHSLGEYLALLVAAENKLRNVGFNGPDPYDILSVEAKDWLKRNPGMLTNYRNRGDAIGNLMGNGTGAEIKISLSLGLNPFQGAFHSLATWKFDANGKLLIPQNDYNQQAELYILTTFAASMSALETIKAKFKASGGGISGNEQIYLDDSQARMVVNTASQAMNVVLTTVLKIYNDGMTEAEELWQMCLSLARGSSSDLSDGEMRKALDSVSCTQNRTVREPTEKYQQKIMKARKLADKFEKLAKEISNKIDELVQRDRELARQLSF
ncbi:alpha/beta hydrolase family protein [Enterococcus rivorum]|uniref:lipase n=1 Tax=Enterococcus rivorum TaxID=762845 RepID=UPI000A8B29CF|nr:lipase [Enterococcus rivorum]MBP2100079.1 hypothetical protein [Enterococcus rivorum]